MGFEQWAILATGPTAVFMTQHRNVLVRRLACFVGLCSQPFWFYASAKAHQWGMFIAAGVYTCSWLTGLYNNWVRPLKAQRVTFDNVPLFDRVSIRLRLLLR